jgi:hypothetical protein
MTPYERPPPRLSDPHARDFDHMSASTYALGVAIASPARTSSTISSTDEASALLKTLRDTLAS